MLYKKICIFLFILFATTSVMAEHAQRHQVVDGLSVYFGVIPAQLIGGHGNMHRTIDMVHGKHTYHILVALFDNKSGKRITEVKMKATVTPLGMKSVSKKLEAMHGDLVSYGNFFTLSEVTPYTIRIEIEGAGNGVRSIAEFTYHRPRD